MPEPDAAQQPGTGPSDRQTLRIGLTGGIASGKSAVADMFASLGVPVIDTDVIAREVVAPGQPALEAIRQRFGDTVIDEHGRLNRAEMRRIVFADDDKRRQLEALLHPRIREETQRQARAAGGCYQVIVVPLLVESPMKSGMDRILVVDVPRTVQLRRLLARDAEPAQQAQSMIDAQASREERLALADDVIDNAGSLEDTRRQVEKLHHEYIARSQCRQR